MIFTSAHQFLQKRQRKNGGHVTHKHGCNLLNASNYLYIPQNEMKYSFIKGLLETAPGLQTTCILSVWTGQGNG